MSVQQTKEVVKQFIASKHNDFLVMRGEWGVGKTFLWNECVSELIIDGNSIYPSHAYVSLFGISSIEELKTTVFASTNSLTSRREKKIDYSAIHKARRLIKAEKFL